MSPYFLKAVIDGICWQDNVTWKRISDCIRLLFPLLFFPFQICGWILMGMRVRMLLGAKCAVCRSWKASLKVLSPYVICPFTDLHMLLHTSALPWAVTYGELCSMLLLLSDAIPRGCFMMWSRMNLECMRWLNWSNITEVHSKSFGWKKILFLSPKFTEKSCWDFLLCPVSPLVKASWFVGCIPGLPSSMALPEWVICHGVPWN